MCASVNLQRCLLRCLRVYLDAADWLAILTVSYSEHLDNGSFSKVS